MDAVADSKGKILGLALPLPNKHKCKCKACTHQFTSGTILASRKMSFVDLVAAIVILSNAVKGVSMLPLSRDLDCQYKTSFVLAHKLREAIASEIKGATLFGTVATPSRRLPLWLRQFHLIASPQKPIDGYL